MAPSAGGVLPREPAVISAGRCAARGGIAVLNDPDGTLALGPGPAAGDPVDPIGEAIDGVLARTRAWHGPADGVVLQRAAAIAAGAGRGPEARIALGGLLALVRVHPDCERL